MFKRLIRALKSMFGGFINAMEDPKLILEQNIRELNDQIPKMNENIATVKANKMMLQKEVKRYEKQIQDLNSKIKSAINSDRDDIAERYAVQLEKAKENLQTSKDQLQYADQAYDKALRVKKAFMREKDQKIQEAKEALRANERAEWQAKVADTLEQFEVGGIDSTHDEMINRINENSAKNEARMEMALDSVDTESMDIEANAEKIRARELVKQFKSEMSGEKSESTEEAASGSETSGRQIEIEEEEKEGQSGKPKGEKQKTVGKDRSGNS